MNVVLIAEITRLIGRYYSGWGSANIVDRGYCAIYMKEERFAGAIAELTRRGVWVDPTPHAPVYYDCAALLATLPEREMVDVPFPLNTARPFREEYVGPDAAQRRDQRLAQLAAAGFAAAPLDSTLAGRFGLSATHPGCSEEPLTRTIRPAATTFDERTASAFVEHYTQEEWGTGDNQWPLWERMFDLMRAGWETRRRGPADGEAPGDHCLYAFAPWRVAEFEDPRDLHGFRRPFEIHQVVRLGLMPTMVYPPPAA